MSKARKISSDLRHVATLAGTTAAIVEGAALATEKARAVTGHPSEGESASAAEVVETSKRAARKATKKATKAARKAGTAAGTVAAKGAEAASVVASSDSTRTRGRKVLVLLVLLVAAGVGVAIWKKRSQALADEELEITDLRDEARFAGSMP